MRVISVV